MCVDVGLGEGGKALVLDEIRKSDDFTNVKISYKKHLEQYVALKNRHNKHTFDLEEFKKFARDMNLNENIKKTELYKAYILNLKYETISHSREHRNSGYYRGSDGILPLDRRNAKSRIRFN